MLAKNRTARTMEPIRFIDPLGTNAGDYYSRNGEWIGSDGLDDDKVYIQDDNGDTQFGPAGTFEELDVKHSELLEMAGVAYGEGSQLNDEKELLRLQALLRTIETVDQSQKLLAVITLTLSANLATISLLILDLRKVEE